jgi:hypothetical protein
MVMFSTIDDIPGSDNGTPRQVKAALFHSFLAIASAAMLFLLTLTSFGLPCPINQSSKTMIVFAARSLTGGWPFLFIREL